MGGEPLAQQLCGCVADVGVVRGGQAEEGGGFYGVFLRGGGAGGWGRGVVDFGEVFYGVEGGGDVGY